MVKLDNLLQEFLGFSALSAACVAGHFEVVRMLCEAGADVNHSNNLGD